jgi:hypothetical protein
MILVYHQIQRALLHGVIECILPMLREVLFLQMQGDQVMQISRMGMSDYFRDIMISTPNMAKLGAYDPYNHNYVIASTSRKNTPCDIQINPTAGSFPYNTAGDLEYLFALSGTTSWSITLINNGFGTNWVELPPYCQAGVGAQNIYGRIQNNTTLAQRSVIVRVFTAVHM